MPLPADFPESLPLGMVSYDVVEYRRDEDSPPGEYARVNPDEYQVEIDPTKPRHTQIVGLFHEWFHLVLMHSGLADVLGSRREEQLCNLVGYSIADLIEGGVLRFGARKKPQ